MGEEKQRFKKRREEKQRFKKKRGASWVKRWVP